MKIEIILDSFGKNVTAAEMIKELAELIQKSEDFELNRASNHWGGVKGGDIQIKTTEQ